MYQENILLLGPDLPSPGPWRAYGDYHTATVQVTGIGTGGVTLEVSNDRNEVTNISQLGDPIAANGIFKIDTGARWIRATGAGTVRLQAQA